MRLESDGGSVKSQAFYILVSPRRFHYCMRTLTSY